MRKKIMLSLCPSLFYGKNKMTITNTILANNTLDKTKAPIPTLPIQINLQVASSIALTVVKMQGIEHLNAPFVMHITALVDPNNFDASSIIQQPATLTLTNNAGQVRSMVGVIHSVGGNGSIGPNSAAVEFELVSRWMELTDQSQSRVILSENPLDVLRQLLLGVGYLVDQIHFDIEQNYDVRPIITQVPNESDFDFFQRLAHACGLCYWDGVENGEAHIYFSDRGLESQSTLLSSLDFIAPSQHASIPEGFYEMRESASRVADTIVVRDFDEKNSRQCIRAEAHTYAERYRGPGSGKPIVQEFFGHGTLTQQEALRQAQVRAQWERVRHWGVSGETNSPLLELARWFSVDAEEFAPGLSWDLFPIAIHHYAKTPQDHLSGKENTIPYWNTTYLIKRATRYCAPFPEHPKVPSTYTAVIESSNAYAELNDSGYYQLRYHHDTGDKAHTQATIPIQRVLPHIAQQKTRAAGFHSALYNGTEVIISPLNGDPDRPLILGTLPNSANTTPVTSNNRTINRYHTQTGHEFRFDDTQSQPQIQLNTPNQAQQLTLNAQSGQELAQLAANQGDMHVSAGADVSLISGTDTTETIGTDLLHTAGQDYNITTSSGNIQHQAQTAFNFNAGQNANLTAQNNIELTSAKDFNLASGRHIRLNIAEKDMKFIAEGNMCIQGENLNFIGNGKGPIEISQNGGGFRLEPDGETINFFGNNINFASQQDVQLNGKVNYSSGAGTQMQGPTPVVTLTPQPINK